MTAQTEPNADVLAVTPKVLASVSDGAVARRDVQLAQATSVSDRAADGTDPLPNLIDLLDRLVEPIAPPPVPLTPQTWGWAVLAVLVSGLLIWLIGRSVMRYRANAYRRAALAELDASGDDPAEIAAILRRTALATWPRARVASLTGDDWLRFLEETGGFPEEQGARLRAAPWRPDCAPSPALRSAAEQWVRNHRVGLAQAAVETGGDGLSKPPAREREADAALRATAEARGFER